MLFSAVHYLYKTFFFAKFRPNFFTFSLQVFSPDLTSSFHCNLSDSKSPWTFLCILADFSGPVWMISIFSLIFISLCLFYKFFRTVSRAPATIDITDNFISGNSWAGSRYLFSFFYILYTVVHWNSKINEMTSFFFFLGLVLVFWLEFGYPLLF